MALRTKLVKWGASHAVQIPKAVLREAGLHEGIEFNISVRRPHLVGTEQPV